MRNADVTATNDQGQTANDLAASGTGTHTLLEEETRWRAYLEQMRPCQAGKGRILLQTQRLSMVQT